jgi:hypothetical protein
MQDFSAAPVMEFAMAMAEPESDEMSAADIKVSRVCQRAVASHKNAAAVQGAKGI